jgi:hypothetical protein
MDKEGIEGLEALIKRAGLDADESKTYQMAITATLIPYESGSRASVRESNTKSIIPIVAYCTAHGILHKSADHTRQVLAELTAAQMRELTAEEYVADMYNAGVGLELTFSEKH